ncbi:PREDICTED: E3 ubiquitin-protein ligase TRIM38-like isoform X1 [Hipposideros armiger]|uniref:E3 ubiquitin-protein ligase TRIM38-like isoform X1 n=1 Tax=Hipposideros armiger TaxID=186990 RepID=A0A8B7QKR0_HIPAR|nr:PREDICTED: E3 ubiquitin-protein ligase TRIM38-like isoform X1 [Hipposideros armiger]XP_019488748.1 PREDICTED: E3 ubiquitin-protein ligase TRIM38-like isoform X1 [Hipposideros armiger]
MASATATERMREEATCSICLSLMTEPQSISCGDSFCQRCIEGFLDNLGHQQPNLRQHPCPQCQAPFRRTSLRPNTQLGNLIEIIKELDQEMTCKEHGEKLHLFCEDDEEFICWRCERSLQHMWHNTTLVEDACSGYKEELQKAVTNMRQLEKECMNRKALLPKQITEWNRQMELQKQKIQDDFKELHRFLQEEEKSFLWRLEKENEQTLKALRDSEASLERKRRELESHIQRLEDRCQGSAQKLLQGVKGALSRSSAVKLDTPEAPSLEVQTVCDVSELYFDVTKLLRGYQVNMTLDPETADPEPILPADHEGFTSGRHYFEVYVGESKQWELGVSMEIVQEDMDTLWKPESGYWVIRLCADGNYIALTRNATLLHLRERPLLVGVFLDYEAGAVSFYNMTTASHIFTFPRASFSGTLRPFIHVYPSSPLSLSPPDE